MDVKCWAPTWADLFITPDKDQTAYSCQHQEGVSDNFIPRRGLGFIWKGRFKSATMDYIVFAPFVMGVIVTY